MPKKMRRLLNDFRAYAPGLSIDEVQQKYKLSKIIKLASNENPLGTSVIVQEAISKISDNIFRYPQSGNPALVSKLAQHLLLPEKNIVLGNGSDEIIDILIRIFAEPSKNNIVAFNPCFSIYKLQSKLCGVDFRQVDLPPTMEFCWNELLSKIDVNTSLIFITNPDNPSGYAVQAAEIRAFAKLVPKNTTLVVDEAYIDFADDYEKYSMITDWNENENIIILRTFSKAYGLAGLRIGYAVLNSEIADYYKRVKLPFSVNLLAEKAASVALEDMDFYKKTLETVKKGREFLFNKLQELGCVVLESQANFLFFSPPIDAKLVFEKLLEKGIIIRPLKSYGFANSLRISIGTMEDNEMFLKEFSKLLLKNK